MDFNFRQLKARISELIDSFLHEEYCGRCRKRQLLISNCKDSDPEEKLYCILLATHFHSLETARDFYQRLNWVKLQILSDEEILVICKEFFVPQRHIGDHRRHLRPKSDGVRYTAEMLQSYKRVITSYGTQVEFFQINDTNPDFETLYHKMAQITHLDSRLARFDHLENVSRAHNFYVTPTRFYSEESSGPLDGLTYVFVGKKYRQEKQLVKNYLVGQFPQQWNNKIGGEYHIATGATFEAIIECLERWVINYVWEQLPAYKRDEKSFVFDLESCLCNWQKGK